MRRSAFQLVPTATAVLALCTTPLVAESLWSGEQVAFALGRVVFTAVGVGNRCR